MTTIDDKSAFLEAMLVEASSEIRAKFERGAREHGQSLDDINPFAESRQETYDKLTYEFMQTRWLKKLLGLLESEDYWEAKDMIRRVL